MIYDIISLCIQCFFCAAWMCERTMRIDAEKSIKRYQDMIDNHVGVKP